jgi:hypothetical protein
MMIMFYPILRMNNFKSQHYPSHLLHDFLLKTRLSDSRVVGHYSRIAISITASHRSSTLIPLSTSFNHRSITIFQYFINKLAAGRSSISLPKRSVELEQSTKIINDDLKDIAVPSKLMLWVANG